MDRKRLTDAITRFIASEEHQVVALSGNWGVGKTFFWRDFVTNFAVPDQLNGHAYASLFGANSITSVRSDIVDGMTLSRDWSSIQERYKDIIATTLAGPRLMYRTFKTIRQFLSNNLPDRIDAASYWFVRDCIVCLDDIERCGERLDGAAIAGLVNELRDRGCKIILILNRNEIRAEHKAIDDYWERIVDIDLKLVPSIEDNSRIVFGSDFRPHQYSVWARATLARVGCDNLRIYKRVAWTIGQLTDICQDLRESTQRDVVEHAAIFCWSVLDPNVRVSPDVILRSRESSFWFEMMDAEEKKAAPDDEANRWSEAAQLAKYSPSPYDDQLMSFILTGWFDSAQFREQLVEVDTEEAREHARNCLYEMYRIYRESFTIDASTYIERLSELLEKEQKNLYVHEFDGAIGTLERAGGDATSLVQDYIKANDKHLDAVAAAANRDVEIKNEILLGEITRRENKCLDIRHSIDGITQGMISDKGWSSGAVEFLASKSADEFVEWIISEPEGLHRKINQILSFSGKRIGGVSSMTFSSEDEARPYRRAALQVERALQSLAEESEFNAHRISRVYGVTSRSKTTDGGPVANNPDKN